MDASIKPPLKTQKVVSLKASLHPFTLLEINHFDIEAIVSDLSKRLEQAPQLLKNAPIVIQLPNTQVPVENALHLLTRLVDLNFIPVGLRCGAENQDLSKALNLPLFNESGSNKSASKTKEENTSQPAKLIRQAVRSGQQVVNPNGDIVILGNVGQGAEVLASGSIHIHGTLYGRALAGFQGDTSATISCQKLQAELLSIGGQYQVSEDLDHSHWQKTCYIHMQDGRLILQSV
jgi:septum site-determining protein MinC